MVSKLLTKDALRILAYDQGLEHGPKDFDVKSVDPAFALDIALKAKYDAIALQKGIALKYWARKYASVPLILKLNGKTALTKGEPFSPPVCSVDQAIALGAKAVGYTVYLGSEFEAQMFEDFARIEKQAHEQGLPVVLWAYPRGEAIARESPASLMAYAARAGLELGADIVKTKYNGVPRDLKWAVQCAGKSRLVVAGGFKVSESRFLAQVREVAWAGAGGIAVGRNVWQDPNPLKISEKIKKILEVSKP